jgi:glycosyltransferase involved in cell wall biosynthesis
MNPDIVWIITPWTWNKIPKRYLKKKKVICTIHHIDEDKFNNIEKSNFQNRDKYVDHYHVVSKKTFEQVSKLTHKPITTIPFWVNNNIWFNIEKTNSLREKYNFDDNQYLIGSFQRDTEGSDLISPKLSKGPDQFFNIVKHLKSTKKNVCVILTGKRREYLINKFSQEGISYKYFPMVNFKKLNELYNILDLYIVASRFEGGPASILECAITKTPIISTDVGLSSEVLSSSSIFDMDNFQNAIPNVEFAYNNALEYKIPKGFDKYNQLLRKLHES